MKYEIGAIVIGRNEGKRLIKCLDSLIGKVDVIVYVDSGSSDNSITEAKKRNVDVVMLALDRPFTAARARNEGAKFLIQNFPYLAFIQFVDGDCEMQADWINKAQEFLEQNVPYAVVCGRRRERFPEQSIYNQLCDIEWNTPTGDALACGGDALIRVEAFKEVEGYRDDLIAGEEPEMCFRLRKQGWKIYRLDAEMTLHDAAITKFSQWWKRTIRTGYAFMLGRSIHGESEERYWVKESQRIMVWGLFLPVSILFLMFISPLFSLLWLTYIVQIARVAMLRPDLGKKKYFWATSIVFGKLAEAFGMMHFWSDRLSNKKVNIIEYK